MDRPDSTQGDRHDTLLFVRRAAGGDGDGVTHRRSGRIPLTLVLVVTLLYLSMRVGGHRQVRATLTMPVPQDVATPSEGAA